MKKLNKKGFTIVELVIVIAIIAILAAVMIPTFSGTIKKAKMSAAFQEVKNAVTEQLAEDMTNAAAAADVVYGGTVETPKVIEVYHDGFVFTVTNGAVSAQGTAANAATAGQYTIGANGLLVVVPNAG